MKKAPRLYREVRREIRKFSGLCRVCVPTAKRIYNKTKELREVEVKHHIKQ